MRQSNVPVAITSRLISPRDRGQKDRNVFSGGCGGEAGAARRAAGKTEDKCVTSGGPIPKPSRTISRKLMPTGKRFTLATYHRN
jgi:hypothetical protein